MMSHVITLSITEESWKNLQGTQRGWFQWLLSDNQLNRIKLVEDIDSLLERHETAQKLRIEHIAIIESGKSNILQKLIAADKNDIKIIFRNQFPTDVVSLLCEQEAEILEAWENVCQGETLENHYFPDRALAKAYGTAFSNWLNTLYEVDLIDYKPAPNRVFSAEEFTYVGTENKAFVFALTAFSSAWLTLLTEKDKIANYAGAFINAPKLHQDSNWNKLDNSFWVQWLNKFPEIPNVQAKEKICVPSLKNLIKNLGEKMLSLQGMTLESAIAEGSDKSITTKKAKEVDLPYIKDEEGNILELYQDKEGTWRVSFQTFYQVVVDEVASVIISSDEKEKVTTQKLRYRDGGWQFDEPLSKLLEGNRDFTHKPSLTVKYCTKDEEQ